jgi:hypothetical protein
MPGAQLRYFVRATGHIVAALGFGASAWKVKPRNQLIGWTTEQRQRNLHLIVNNAHFLILPWVHCQNLASRVLALVSRRLAGPLRLSAGLARNLCRKATLHRHLLQDRQLAAPGRYAGPWQARYPASPRPADQKHLDLPAHAPLPAATLQRIDRAQCRPSSSCRPFVKRSV